LRQPPAIEGYGAGGFRIGGDWHSGSVLILDDLPRPWSLGRLEDLTLQSLEPVFAGGHATVEFVLLGAGKTTAPPPKGVRRALEAEGLGLEVMDTASACRHYNLFAQEGRRIAAALIAI